MKNKIRQLVERLIEQCGTADPTALCAALALPVFSVPLPDGINGMYCKIRERSAILIQEALPEEQRSYCLAHELGHALLHPTLNTAFLAEKTCFALSKLEREADYFAAVLLLFDHECTEGETAEEIARKTGLPSAAVLDWAETNNKKAG